MNFTAIAPEITAFYAGLLALIYILLAFRVAKFRIGTKTSIGDDGSEAMQTAIRVHGNFIEYVPFALILIGFLEMRGNEPWMIHALGVALFVARAGHAIGLTRSRKINIGRSGGIMLTWAVILAAALVNIFQSGHVFG